MELNHIKFELVPAVKNYFGTKSIPAPANSYNQWIQTCPEQLFQNEKLKNAATSYKFKLVVRLLKVWNVKQGKVFSSYELETKLVGMIFGVYSSLEQYLYVAIENLNGFFMPAYKQQKLTSLKSSISRAKDFKSQGLETCALNIIKSLFE